MIHISFTVIQQQVMLHLIILLDETYSNLGNEHTAFEIAKAYLGGPLGPFFMPTSVYFSITNTVPDHIAAADKGTSRGTITSLGTKYCFHCLCLSYLVVISHFFNN